MRAAIPYVVVVILFALAIWFAWPRPYLTPTEAAFVVFLDRIED
jgi:hypothetical protein